MKKQEKLREFFLLQNWFKLGAGAGMAICGKGIWYGLVCNVRGELVGRASGGRWRD